jgi:hypothetical protein
MVAPERRSDLKCNVTARRPHQLRPTESESLYRFRRFRREQEYTTVIAVATKALLP